VCGDKQIFLNSGSRLPDFTRICLLLGLRCTVCMSDYTDETYRKFLGLRCVLIRVPSYPTTRVVAVTYSVCVYLLYGGPTSRTHRIVNFLVCVIRLLWYPDAAIRLPRYSDVHEVLGLRLYTMCMPDYTDVHIMVNC